MICLAEHMISLGPWGLREFCKALAKYGNRGVAAVLHQLVIAERKSARLSQSQSQLGILAHSGSVML